MHMLCGIVFLICIVTPHPAFIYSLSITEIDYTDLSCSMTSAIILFGVFLIILICHGSITSATILLGVFM